MTRCPSCGTQYPDDARFCTKDGTRLIGGTTPAQGYSRSTAPLTRNEMAVPVTHATLTGKTLEGRYEIVKKIGEGGMSFVYLANDVATRERYAIKVLSAALSQDANAMARLRREASLGMRLAHPNVCHIIRLGETEDGLVYVVMPFVDGEILADKTNRLGRLQLQDVASLLRDMAAGLHIAHELKIVHRDLKPENIMVCRGPDGADYAVVMDFGLAKERKAGAELQKLTATGIILGTPEFMSPEQLRGKPLDARTDIYSLALMAYEMLSGKLPFSGRTQQEMMIARLRSDPTPLRKLAAGARFPRGDRACFVEGARARTRRAVSDDARVRGRVRRRGRRTETFRPECGGRHGSARTDCLAASRSALLCAVLCAAALSSGAFRDVHAQRSRPYRPAFDVSDYALTIDLPDTGSTIHGTALLTVARVAHADTLKLDLLDLDVSGVSVDGRAAKFARTTDGIDIVLPSRKSTAATFEVSVEYGGAVKDGLIVRQDSMGRWTYFGDNWPNRARHWIPSIDHPSDKATVTWRVRAPSERTVIANGRLVSRKPPAMPRAVIASRRCGARASRSRRISWSSRRRRSPNTMSATQHADWPSRSAVCRSSCMSRRSSAIFFPGRLLASARSYSCSAHSSGRSRTRSSRTCSRRHGLAEWRTRARSSMPTAASAGERCATAWWRTRPRINGSATQSRSATGRTCGCRKGLRRISRRCGRAPRVATARFVARWRTSAAQCSRIAAS